MWDKLPKEAQDILIIYYNIYRTLIDNMGIITTIFDFITSFDGSSYIEDAKRWGDGVWNDMNNVRNGILSLTMIDERLYKQLRLEFRNGTVGVFTESDDRGWVASNRDLTKQQRRQLKEEGCITIKRYR